MQRFNMNDIVGRHSILLMTFDTLRYDAAVQCYLEGLTPNLARLIPQGWEERHTPATFTYAAHHAFFAGFLPTPVRPGKHERLFAARFEGSETTTDNTFIFQGADVISGLRQIGYRTICIGGVGFFNKRSPLGSVLPSLFDESYWEPDFGVTNPRSAEAQFAQAARSIENAGTEKFLLFVNLSAIHQPNYFYGSDTNVDNLTTHRAALQYIDRHLPILTNALQQQGGTFCILCADHGTTYGEDGYTGHRLSHPMVLTVPYADTILMQSHD